MEKKRLVSGLATLLFAALFIAFNFVTANAIGRDGSRTGFGVQTGGNRMLPLGQPNELAPQVPDILRSTTKQFGFDDLAPEGNSSGTTVDMNGDGKSDFVLVRNTGGGPSGQLTWFFAFNGTGASGGFSFGLNTDWVLMEDFDGDLKDDITVWRPGVGGNAAFFIFQSATSTVSIIQYGQTGDIPSVIGDYDNDGKADAAVYRPGSPALWFYRASSTGNTSVVQWGTTGDVPAPGDFDGDGKNDFGIYRNSGTGQLDFWRILSNGTVLPVIRFGSPADVYVPGDYDGDHKTDIALFRLGGNPVWNWVSSANGSVHTVSWGLDGDKPVQGDYDADGKTDIAIWRPSVTPGQSAFWVQLSSTGNPLVFSFGTSGDFPAAAYNAF